jgi:AraC-like DNA-binding protein
MMSSSELLAWADSLEAATLKRSHNFSLLKHQFCLEHGGPNTHIDLIDDKYLRIGAMPVYGRGETQFLQAGNDIQIVTSRSNRTENLALRFIGENWLRFSFTLSGDILFDLGDGRQVGMPSGSSFFGVYPAGYVSTDFFISGKSVEWVSIIIKASELQSILGVDLNELPQPIADAINKATTPVFHQENRIDNRTAQIVTQMLLAGTPLYMRPMFMLARALELISIFLAKLSADTEVSTNQITLSARDRKNLALAREIVSTDMMTSLTLPDLARMVGLNRNKLSQGFRAVYGVTLQDYSYQLKMKRAENYLKNREGSLNELADILGYRHANNLSAAIKKHFGVNPGQLKGRG